MDFTWLWMQIWICWSQMPYKKYLPLFASCSTTHLLHIELIRLLIVACGMLSHSSMAVWSCWILAWTGTRCCTHQSRASQTCSMGDMSGECAGHGRHFQLPGIVYRSLRHGAGPSIFMLKHEVMSANEWHDNDPRDLVTLSLCNPIAIDKLQLCSLSLAYCLPPPPPRGTLFTTLTSANHSPTRRHTRRLQLWGLLDVPNSLKQRW